MDHERTARWKSDSNPTSRTWVRIPAKELHHSIKWRKAEGLNVVWSKVTKRPDDEHEETGIHASKRWWWAWERSKSHGTWERERERERERESVCMWACVRERECVWERERERGLNLTLNPLSIHSITRRTDWWLGPFDRFIAAAAAAAAISDQSEKWTQLSYRQNPLIKSPTR